MWHHPDQFFFVMDEGEPQDSVLSVLLMAICFNGVDLGLYVSGAKFP